MAALVGLNTDLRREYIADCQGGVKRWNRILEGAGLPQRLALPHIAFNRKVGAFAGIEASPAGETLTADEWEQRKGQWLPTDTDKTYVRSLMQPGARARQDRGLDRPAAQGHQRPAVRLRLRAPHLGQVSKGGARWRSCSTPASTCSTGGWPPATATGSR